MTKTQLNLAVQDTFTVSPLEIRHKISETGHTAGSFY